MSTPARRRHLSALVRALRENGRLLTMLARWCEADRLTPLALGETFRTPADIAAHLGLEMAELRQEQLRVMLLDRRGRLIDTPLVYQGGQSETAVHLADCFREAVRRTAAAIVLIHNHPSGDPSASADDVQLTHDAGQAGLLLGIQVLDHVIVSHDGFVSLRAEGLYIPPDAAGAARNQPEAASALAWGYDCTRCGARVRGLESSTDTCRRCLAPVTPRVMQPAPQLPAPELPTPAAV